MYSDFFGVEGIPEKKLKQLVRVIIGVLKYLNIPAHKDISSFSFLFFFRFWLLAFRFLLLSLSVAFALQMAQYNLVPIPEINNIIQDGRLNDDGLEYIWSYMEQRSQITYHGRVIDIDWNTSRLAPVIRNELGYYFVESPDIPGQSITMRDVLHATGIAHEQFFINWIDGDSTLNIDNLLDTTVKDAPLNQLSMNPSDESDED
jgi:hypothetical protein